MAEPKQARALQTREHILRAAAGAFDELGYKGASMREIMRRAGVTLGAVYFHFENKEALARAVILAQPQEMVPRLESEGLQRLVDFTLVWAHQLNVNPLMRAAVRLAVEQKTHGIGDDVSYGEFESLFAQWLTAAHELGELVPGTDPEPVAEFLVGALTGVQHYAHLSGATSALPGRVSQMWTLLLPGIAKPEVVQRVDVDASRGR
ncbi:ScbR family autoregulator-binding transcription factor [Streptomyces sp. NPDC002851]